MKAKQNVRLVDVTWRIDRKSEKKFSLKFNGVGDIPVTSKQIETLVKEIQFAVDKVNIMFGFEEQENE